MPTPHETITVDSLNIACDGGHDEPGHPRVFLSLEKTGTVDCPYCGRRYILEVSAQTAAH